MLSDTAQQLVTLLQEAGILSLEAVETVLTQPETTVKERLQTLLTSGALSLPALQEAWRHIALSLPMDGIGMPDQNSQPETSERTVDEYYIDDQQLRAILLQEGRGHPE